MAETKTRDINLRIAVAGPPDAGKSSLIGVLKSGKTDDGRGSARSLVLQTKHEQETGRTSCISFHPLIETMENERRILSLVDLAGHEKYMKTTMYGINGLNIDYGIVLVASNMGMSNITIEHVRMMYTLKIPFIIVVSKLDLCPANILSQTMSTLNAFLKKNIPTKKSYVVRDIKKDAHLLSLFRESHVIIPIFQVSNKTGLGIDAVKDFIFSLPPREKYFKTNNTVFKIDSTFYVKGIGLVFSGYLTSGMIKVDDHLYLGPKGGKFIPVKIKTMHNTIRENITELRDSGCVSIAFVDKKNSLRRKDMRKGMVLIGNVENVSFKFRAEIRILHHATTIQNNYQPVIHCGTIRQSASLRLIEKKTMNENPLLRSGDIAIVEFTFMYHAEFLEKDRVFSFRDGSTKGIGKVVEIL